MNTDKSTNEKTDRRKFLVRLGGTTAIITLSGTVIGSLRGNTEQKPWNPGEGIRWSRQNTLPNVNATVIPVDGTRKELTPLEDHYNIINTKVPREPDMVEWRLRVEGLVESPVEWTLEDIMGYPSQDHFVTLTCISNPVGGPLSSTTRWTGVSLQKILPKWKLLPTATHLWIRGADKFHECVPLQAVLSDVKVMLVYEWDGVPLPMKNGFPLRIYIPDRFGMKQPKWIESIEAIDHWEPGFSVKNTWDKDAMMETTSVIDTLKVEEGDRKSVLIGGIAHGGARGISAVEVKVDDGKWQPAQLRSPLSELTWIVWRYEWLFVEGSHTFEVRAIDKRGVRQETIPSPHIPMELQVFTVRKLFNNNAIQKENTPEY